MANKLTSLLPTGTNNFLNPLTSALRYQTDTTTPGVIGTISTNAVAPSTGALAVNAQATPNMSVAVTAGNLYVTATAAGGAALLYSVTMDVTENVTISSNTSGLTAYDFVYMQLDSSKLNNPAVSGLDVATLITSRSSTPYSATAANNGNSLGAISNALLLGVVTVANGVASISNANIADGRVRATMGLSIPSTGISIPVNFSVYRSAGLSYANQTVMPFDTKLYDKGNNVDISTNAGRFTVPTTGFYQFSAGLTFTTSGASTAYSCYLRKNGSQILSGKTTVNMFTSPYQETSIVSGMLQLTAGDYIEVAGQSASLSTTITGSPFTYFSGYLVCT